MPSEEVATRPNKLNALSVVCREGFSILGNYRSQNSDPAKRRNRLEFRAIKIMQFGNFERRNFAINMAAVQLSALGPRLAHGRIGLNRYEIWFPYQRRRGLVLSNANATINKKMIDITRYKSSFSFIIATSIGASRLGRPAAFVRRATNGGHAGAFASATR
jgi:hypothetical protein